MLWAETSLYISFWIRSQEENQNVLIIPVAESVFSDLFSHLEKICSFIGKLFTGWWKVTTLCLIYHILGYYVSQTVLLYILSALFLIRALLLQRPFGRASLKWNIL